MREAAAAVVGVGEVPPGRFPERSGIEAAVLTARKAMLDAGLSPRDPGAAGGIGAATANAVRAP